MELNSVLSSTLRERLIANLLSRRTIGGQSMNVDPLIHVASFMKDGIVPPANEVVSEQTVYDVQTAIHRISDKFATLSCFDIDNSDIGRNISVFTIIPSPEVNTKADGLVGCRPTPGDTQEMWQSLWPSITKPRDISHPFFRTMYTEEYKNIRSGNPRVILGIYIIIWCLKKKHLVTFWPELQCSGCSTYKKSHRADDAYDGKVPEECPLDATEALDTTEALDADDDFNILRGEINRVVILAQDYETRYNIPSEKETQTAKKRKHFEREDSGSEEEEGEEGEEGEEKELDTGEDQDNNTETSETEDSETSETQSVQFVPYRQILEDAMKLAIEELELPPNVEDGLIRWVLNAVYMLIQVNSIPFVSDWS
jgi:hypothetical protein